MATILNEVSLFLGWIVIGILACFLVLEFIFRVKKAILEELLEKPITRKDFIDKAYHPYLGWAEDWKHAMFSYLPVGFRLFNTNNLSLVNHVTNDALGYRRADISESDPEEFTVLLLGGSTAWGSGASSNEHTIAGQLEKLINDHPSFLKKNQRARVINLAQTNGHQTQDILSTIFHGSRAKPDVVISLTGWNELVANYPMDMDIVSKYRVFYITEMAGWEPIQVHGRVEKTLVDTLGRWIDRKSELLKVLRPRTTQNQSSFDYSIKELESRLSITSDVFLEHLEYMNNIANGFGFKHYQFLQPTLYRKEVLSPQEQKVLTLYDEIRPVHGGKEIGDFIRNTNVYSKILTASKDSPETYGPVIDLYDFFKKETDQCFFTLVHLTDAGYQKIAEQIFAQINSKESV